MHLTACVAPPQHPLRARARGAIEFDCMNQRGGDREAPESDLFDGQTNAIWVRFARISGEHGSAAEPEPTRELANIIFSMCVCVCCV